MPVKQAFPKQNKLTKQNSAILESTKRYNMNKNTVFLRPHNLVKGCSKNLSPGKYGVGNLIRKPMT